MLKDRAGGDLEQLSDLIHGLYEYQRSQGHTDFYPQDLCRHLVNGHRQELFDLILEVKGGAPKLTSAWLGRTLSRL